MIIKEGGEIASTSTKVAFSQIVEDTHLSEIHFGYSSTHQRVKTLLFKAYQQNFVATVPLGPWNALVVTGQKVLIEPERFMDGLKKQMIWENSFNKRKVSCMGCHMERLQISNNFNGHCKHATLV